MLRDYFVNAVNYLVGHKFKITYIVFMFLGIGMVMLSSGDTNGNVVLNLIFFGVAMLCFYISYMGYKLNELLEMQVNFKKELKNFNRQSVKKTIASVPVAIVDSGKSKVCLECGKGNGLHYKHCSKY